MRAEGLVHNRRYEKSGDHRAIGIASDYFPLNNFLRNYNHLLRSTHCLQHHSEVSPAMSIALSVGALHVGDGYIRHDSADRKERLLWFKRGNNLIKEVIAL